METKQIESTPQIERQPSAEVAEHAGSVVLDRLVEKVRDEAIDGIPVQRDQIDITMNLMRDRTRRFTSRKH